MAAGTTAPFESFQPHDFDHAPVEPPNFDPVLIDPPQGIKEKFSVARAWTPKLAARYVPVSRFFLENYWTLGLSPEEALFVIHLLQHKWNERAPYPSYKKIASLMGVTDKTVRRFAQALELKGYLKRVRRSGLPTDST